MADRSCRAAADDARALASIFFSSVRQIGGRPIPFQTLTGFARAFSLAILWKFRLAASCRYHLDAESIAQAPKQQALKQLVLRRGVAAKRWALNDDEISSNKLNVAPSHHGLNLDGRDSRIDTVAVDAHIELVQQRLRTVANLASYMPAIDEFLAISRTADRTGAS